MVAVSVTDSDHWTSFDMASERERAKDMMPSGQETLVILVDYKTTTLRSNPSISVASKVNLSLSVVGHDESCLTGSYDSPATLRGNAGSGHRNESPVASQFLLQRDRPFYGSRYSGQGRDGPFDEFFEC